MKLNKTIGWHLGNRSVKTFKPFFRKCKDLKNTIFYKDNWEVYKKIIPKNQLIMGKKETIEIEQKNSNIRHYLKRFNRRVKVISHSKEMIDVFLKLFAYMNEYDGFQKLVPFIYI